MARFITLLTLLFTMGFAPHSDPRKLAATQIERACETLNAKSIHGVAAPRPATNACACAAASIALEWPTPRLARFGEKFGEFMARLSDFLRHNPFKQIERGADIPAPDAELRANLQPFGDRYIACVSQDRDIPEAP